MAQNRIIPYGYMITNGKLQINQQEKEIVIEIFKRYANGESYSLIAEWLTKSKIVYIGNKTDWNKNIIARILQNKNYIGNEKYPSILSKELYADVKTNTKTYTHTESQDIKNIKPLLVCSKCGAMLKRRLKSSGEERWYCPNNIEHISTKLNDKILLSSIFELQKNIIVENIVTERQEKDFNSESTIKLKNQIEISMASEEIDAEKIKEDIIKLATEKYNNLINFIEYETSLKYKLSNISKEKLESTKIKEAVNKIIVAENRAIKLIMKNGQQITT